MHWTAWGWMKERTRHGEWRYITTEAEGDTPQEAMADLKTRGLYVESCDVIYLYPTHTSFAFHKDDTYDKAPTPRSPDTPARSLVDNDFNIVKLGWDEPITIDCPGCGDKRPLHDDYLCPDCRMKLGIPAP